MAHLKTNTSSVPSRYLRYKRIVDRVSNDDRFLIDDIKADCCEEQPAFVTRVIRELEREGWLVREDSDPEFLRWNQGRGLFQANKWLDATIFGGQIKGAPERERPRERLLYHGAENLRTSELIAILVRSGRPGESAVVAGEKVAKAFDGRLDKLPMAGRAELKEVSSAVEKTAFCQIMAGIELGRRIAAVSDQPVSTKITSSVLAVEFSKRHFRRLATESLQEEFHIVTLDTKNQVIDSHQITVGTLDASLVHPREVFRPAIKDAAASIILVHNHPSGDPEPSAEDLAVTRRLTTAGEMLGIDVLDHIVVGNPGAVSIREYTHTA